MTKLLTVKQLADALQVKPSWVYRRTSEGDIPVIRVGRYVRFEWEPVLKWLRKEYGRGSRLQDWIPGYNPTDGGDTDG